jgi:hypothetical protein
MRWQNGIKRLVVTMVAFLGVATVAYFVGEIFLFERRSSLIVPEIIGYVVVANVLTICAFFVFYRLYQWVLRGFDADRGKQ